MAASASISRAHFLEKSTLAERMHGAAQKNEPGTYMGPSSSSSGVRTSLRRRIKEEGKSRLSQISIKPRWPTSLAEGIYAPSPCNSSRLTSTRYILSEMINQVEVAMKSIKNKSKSPL